MASVKAGSEKLAKHYTTIYLKNNMNLLGFPGHAQKVSKQVYFYVQELVKISYNPQKILKSHTF